VVSNGLNQITLTGELDNRNTVVAADTDNQSIQGIVGNDVSIQAQDIRNDQGLIQSNTQATLIANAEISNTQGGTIIASSDAATLSTSLTANSINNTNGSILVNNENLALTAQSISNVNGLISHAGTGDLSLNAQTQINNGDGSVVTNGSINIGSNNNEVANLDNQGGEISALQTIIVFAENVLNDLGLIQTQNGDINITASESLENNNGVNADGSIAQSQITSGNNLTLNTPLFNGDGIVQAANELQLTVPSFNNQSDLRAGVNLIIETANFINEAGGSLTSNGSLTFDLTGGFTNNGLLSTLNDINIDANTFTNNGVLTIDGNGFFDIVGLATNNGTLTAATDFDITANEFNNTGAFGAGNRLLLQADTITNTSGAAIFSGGTTTFLAQNLINQEADIFSLGDIVFAGQENPDFVPGDGSLEYLFATSLENISGNIESEGNISLFTDNVSNRRLFFSTEERRVAAAFTFECIDCSDTSFTTDFILTEEFLFVASANSTDESNLIAGENLTVFAQDVVNEFSVIAANENIDIETDNFTNEGLANIARQVTSIVRLDDGSGDIEDAFEQAAIFNDRFAPIQVNIAQGQNQSNAQGLQNLENALCLQLVLMI